MNSDYEKNEIKDHKKFTETVWFEIILYFGVFVFTVIFLNFTHLFDFVFAAISPFLVGPLVFFFATVVYFLFHLFLSNLKKKKARKGS